VAGTTTLGGAYANLATTTGGASFLELAGPITGAGALNKFGGATTAYGTLRISGTSNNYSGGTNVQVGALQVTGTTGTPLGTGPVSVLPGAALRIAGNGSLSGVTTLNLNSQVNTLPAVVLDTDYNPGTGLNSIMKLQGGFGASLQIAVPAFNSALNMANFGDGTSFLGGYGATEIQYLAPTLGVGAGNTYRLGANTGPNLAFVGSGQRPDWQCPRHRWDPARQPRWHGSNRWQRHGDHPQFEQLLRRNHHQQGGPDHARHRLDRDTAGQRDGRSLRDIGAG